MTGNNCITISFANQKGGVGKSTLCIQTAFWLSENNKKVLVIDMDTQGNTSSRLLPGDLSKQINKDLVDENDVRISKAADLFKSDFEVELNPIKCPRGMDLIYTPRNDPLMAEVETESLNISTYAQKHLSKIKENYDYILIDCPPSLGRKLVAALLCSSHVVIPVKVSGFAVDGVYDILGSIVSLQRSSHKDLKVAGIVINDIDRSVSHQKSVEQLQGALKDLLFKNMIRHRSPLDTATSEGIAVWDLPYGHVAAKEVKAVIKELIERTS